MTREVYKLAGREKWTANEQRARKEIFKDAVFKEILERMQS
jgi:hypothetical protein